MSQPAIPPPVLEKLSKYREWALPTLAERKAKRMASTPEVLKEFYADAMASVDELLNHLNQFPLDEIPSDAMPYFYIALSLAEIGIYVEWFDGGVSPVARNFRGVVEIAYEPKYVR